MELFDKTEIQIIISLLNLLKAVCPNFNATKILKLLRDNFSDQLSEMF